MDPELQRRAHAKAADLGLSFAEYVRRLVAHDVGQPKPITDISCLFDLGASREPTDIARDKHQMIGEAAWSEHSHKIAPKTGGRARRRARPGTEHR
jgi:hypothetical protein